PMDATRRSKFVEAIRSLKISISGVRGVVGESLTPLLLTRFAQAFGTYLNSGLIVVGRDTRTSGEMVKNAVFSGLISSGCWVVDLDVVPVPTIQLMVERLQASGGLAITASHNPAEWNALKFIRSDGIFLNSYQAEELLNIYHQGEFKKVKTPGLKKLKIENKAVEVHIRSILKHLDVDLIKSKKFKVALDCCNGAGSVMAPEFLKRLGCRVTSINTKPSGLFPHPPEPIPENLGALCQKVTNCGAEIGFAQDADADRLAIVSEEGKPVGEESTLALAVSFILSKRRGKVVTNLSTSLIIDELACKYDCEVIRTKVGEVNVAERMKKEKAVIGGEGNGGVILPEVHYARDSFVAMGLTLQYLAEKELRISQLVKEFPSYRMVKKKVTCPSDKIQMIIKDLKERYKRKRLDLTEGVKVLYPHSWVHIRPSNTEPIIRIIAEGKTKKEANKLCEDVLKRM
ncbi:MAG: phosphoglucosamine mutase, partial [Armatimonadetes bacterium CG07_land_8_20_14_0_80_40_9]